MPSSSATSKAILKAFKIMKKQNMAKFGFLFAYVAFDVGRRNQRRSTSDAELSDAAESPDLAAGAASKKNSSNIL